MHSFYLVIVQLPFLGGLFLWIYDTLCSVPQTLHNTEENYIMLNGVFLICSVNCQELLSVAWRYYFSAEFTSIITTY